MADYKSTMNLPKTEFPMRANLAQREPGWLERWDQVDIYRKSLENRQGAELFILHDGPPYANGHIHMGTAYNKVLKDIIVKYKSMRGYLAPYVPGWDCHGQPIEHQVEKRLGREKMKAIGQAKVRELCRDYALEFVGIQREEFKRLGVRGDWENPYLTLRPSYEAGNVKVFKKMYDDGMIYKGRKPIHWCMSCHTALAEAEIEYHDIESDSIYVAFRFTAPTPFDAEGEPYVLVWTTTPWTLPANVAVTLADDAEYVGVSAGGKVLVMAADLVEKVAEAVGWDEGDYEVVGPRVKGSELTGLTYAQPIHDGVEGVIITGSHVELSTGTGAVHTAPGHGEDDYLVGAKFGLPMPMPVDDEGVFDAGGGPFEGMKVWDANPEVRAFLAARGVLIGEGRIEHSYPHCWRCKNPVIFRATEQWFVSMDKTGLRDAALKTMEDVEWIPGWSVNRMSSMVSDRPDWCISRQRAWGVPIPVFTCSKCGETVATDATFDAVIELFETEGADAWFIKQPSDYLPADTTCSHCGAGTESLMPEKDILDVWWESGVSHTSVLEAREELRRPADMYLEGTDQHRGWFQSALLTSVGAYGVAPYKSVLTHGFIVDGDGRKMSKSVGNVILPPDVIKRSGADIIRLWVASADYGQDVNMSEEIIDRTSEAYRRIRNTFRFLLSNLYDYDPSRAIAFEDMPELDRFALAQLEATLAKITEHYDGWRFHAVYRTLSDYVGDLSSLYLDVLKDRLYSDAPDSNSRRSAQTVLARILGVLVRVYAPILTFTCEEAWDFMPEGIRDADSVQLTDWPTPQLDAERTAGLLDRWQTALEARSVVTAALEIARNERTIGKSQEAAVSLSVPAAELASLRDIGEERLAELFIVSSVVLTEGMDSIEASVGVAEGEKCPRCWNYRELGHDPERPDLCERCAAVLAASTEPSGI